MSIDLTARGLLNSIILEETKYLRHYPAIVVTNVDIENKGRVLVTCDELGMSTPDLGIWAVPRFMHSMTVPMIGEYVELYFIAGDPNRPVYLGKCNEMFLQLPNTFDGKFTTHVVFESPTLKKGIVFDEVLGKLILDFILCEIGAGASEAMVLGNTLKTELQKVVDQLTQLNADFTAWVPVPNDGGAALKTVLGTGFLTKPQALLTSILSLFVKTK
jgi:hypothetical protein